MNLASCVHHHSAAVGRGHHRKAVPPVSRPSPGDHASPSLGICPACVLRVSDVAHEPLLSGFFPPPAPTSVTLSRFLRAGVSASLLFRAPVLFAQTPFAPSFLRPWLDISVLSPAMLNDLWVIPSPAATPGGGREREGEGQVTSVLRISIPSLVSSDLFFFF